VSDIVAEITSASSEQSSGVQQVGEAVSQMDQATQQNAALVEESAAAAESLRSQAQQLVQAVAVFKLSRQDGFRGGNPTAALTSPAPTSERRSAHRSSNVVLPAFKAKADLPAAAKAQRDVPRTSKAAADSWETF
jgi:hypothetical protein